MYTYVYIQMYMKTHWFAHNACAKDVYIYTYTYIYIHMYTYIYLHIHIHTSVYMCI